MTKGDLSRIIARKHGISGTKAKEVVNTIFQELAKSIKKGELVQLYGFARIEVYKGKPCSRTNFKTSERIKVEAKRRIRVVFSEEIKKGL